MDKRLFAHEDISLNENIKKSGYKIYYEPTSYIYHKDWMSLHPIESMNR